ncbi:MAG: hypothetical protein WA954_10690 [Parerythrobacter sp.]
MTWRKYLVAASAIALTSFPLNAGEERVVGIDFASSEIAPSPILDDLPQSFQPKTHADWVVAEQLRRTEATSSDPNSGSLASGWIDRNLYVLIEQGQVTYLIQRPDPVSGSRPASEVCRISILTQATNIVFPDAIAQITESERGCKAPPSWFLKRLVRSRPSAGEVSDQTQFKARDGLALKVRHFTNAYSAGAPLVTADKAESISSIYQMPTTYLLARKTAQRAWIVENNDQKYSLAVKFDIERTGERSGCFIQADDGRFPSLDWISNDIRQWCVEQDLAFARSVRKPELEPRPAPPREK